MIQLTVGGATARPDAVTYRQRGFAGPADIAFVLTYDYASFARKLAPTYDAVIDELVRDDGITGAFDPPYSGAVTYPTLEELFALPDASRMEMIGTFLRFHILQLFFAEESLTARWTVRALDSVARHGDVVELRGRVDETPLA